MRKIKEILRLNQLGLTRREIGRSLSISHNTVADIVRRAEASGISWPAAEQMDEAALDARLYPRAAPSLVKRPEPDPEQMHRALARKGVTLQLLWLEYKAEHPQGLGYTQFCERYRRWHKKADVVLRQEHKAGEKLFVDFAGQTVPVTHRHSGEVTPAHIFVAVLGCSNYIYAEATRGEDSRSFLDAHVHCFAALGGAPHAVVIDYVPGHIIDLMFPPALCGRGLVEPLVSWRCVLDRPHSDHRESSHRSNSWSSRHVALRGDPGE